MEKNKKLFAYLSGFAIMSLLAISGPLQAQARSHSGWNDRNDKSWNDSSEDNDSSESYDSEQNESYDEEENVGSDSDLQESFQDDSGDEAISTEGLDQGTEALSKAEAKALKKAEKNAAKELKKAAKKEARESKKDARHEATADHLHDADGNDIVGSQQGTTTQPTLPSATSTGTNMGNTTTTNPTTTSTGALANANTTSTAPVTSTTTTSTTPAESATSTTPGTSTNTQPTNQTTTSTAPTTTEPGAGTNVSMGKPLQQGMVTFTFDDGYASQFQNAKPILDGAGIKATFFVINGSVGQTPLYMTKEQLLELKDDGMEIGAHSQTHADLAGLTDEQLQLEVKGSKTDPETIIGAPVVSFSYPFGTYDERLIQAVKDAGYLGARITDEGYNGSDANEFALNDRHLESTVTGTQVQGWIDEALANKQWLILESHVQGADGGQYSNTPETLQSIVDYLMLKGVKTVTMQEGLQILGQ